MKIKIFIILMCCILFVTGCDNLIENKVYISYDDLNEVNNKIIDYFTLNGVEEYDNYSFNYVDIDNRVVVVGLLDNTEVEQEKFKKLVVDSELIKFVQGERMVDE